jgi:hypothetical protein
MRSSPSWRRRQSLPSALRNPRERREYVVAFGIVAALQLGIAVSLVVSAAQTYRLAQQRLPYVPREVGRVVPAFLLLGAAIALAASLRTIGRIRAARAVPIEPRAGD